MIPDYQYSSSRELDSLPEGIIFYEGFDNGLLPELPADWSTFSVSDQGFYVGTSGGAVGQSNEGGFFPVPNHGLYVMTNDDRCNCDKSQDLLISKRMDLTGLEYLRLGFSAFQNGAANQSASVQVRNGNASWKTILLIPAHSQWQDYSVEIPVSYLSENFQLRFFYDDKGRYASGLAVDDIYLSSKPTTGIRANQLFSESKALSGTGIFARQIPLAHARYADMQFGLAVRNASSNGKNARIHADVSGPVTYDENLGTWLIEQSSSDTISFTRSESFSSYDTGFYQVTVSLETDSFDDNLQDNRIESNFRVVDSTYRYLLNSNDQTGILFPNPQDRAGSVFQWYASTDLVSVWVGIHPLTEVGTTFRIKLFDAGFLSSSIYTSPIHTVTDEKDLVRIPINESFPIGRYYVAIESEVGQLVVKTNSEIPSVGGVSFYKPANRAWQNLAYYPDLTMVTTPIDSNCLGHIQATVNEATCPGDSNGQIVIDPVGMNNPTYAWSTGDVSNTLENLGPDTFGVTVTDNSCAYERVFILKKPDTLKLKVQVKPALCGYQNGEIFFKPEGGVEPYAFSYNSEPGFQRLSNLSKDTVLASVIDQRGCSIDTSLIIPATDTLSIATNLELPHCGQSDGVISTIASGTSPIVYAWNTGQQSPNLSGLESGIYAVTITDSLGCSIDQRIFLPDSFAPAIFLDSSIHVGCSDQPTGKIEVSVVGDNAPFDFYWSNGEVTSTISGLIAGTYRLTVSDTATCKSFLETEVTELHSPLLADLKQLGIKCHGDSTGEIETFLTGGLPPYLFSWNDGLDTSRLESLSPGTYTVTINDGAGCERVLESALYEQPELLFVIDELVGDTTDNNQFDAAIYTSTYGGTPPYEYHWSNGSVEDDLVNVDTGFYSVTVTDQFGCSKSIEQQLDAVILADNDNQAEMNNVSIYPNPISSGDVLTIDSDEKILGLTMLDMSGRNIEINSKTSKHRSLTISNPGAYILSIETESETYFRKVVVYQ